MPKTKQRPLPFHVDLNGWERVTRAFARKLWSWGIPVFQDCGRGASRLPAPYEAPAKDAKGGFDAACLSAAGENGPFTEALRRKCTYLVKSGTMALHFTFKDGSNPFVKYGQPVELLPELWAWSKRYAMRADPASDPSIAQFELEERCPAAGSLFAPGP